MKTLKILKAFDILGQLGLTVWLIVLPYAAPAMFGPYGTHAQIDGGIFTWLCAFGAWQVISWLLHWLVPRQATDRRLRRIYGFCLIPAPILMWTVFFYPIPMAIFYFSICCLEVFGRRYRVH